ncbi:hypothetical protein B484DRAFT_410229 [Ochromonadaceae sp. CCMP2298]|nr:hypothetical protein B484DRAFT_410229 [Ochromonadaceae sp. CCMP2298]
MREVVDYARSNSLLVFMANVLPEVGVLLTKSHIESDEIRQVDGVLHDSIMDAVGMVGSASNPGLDVESLGVVQSLLADGFARERDGEQEEAEGAQGAQRGRTPAQFWNLGGAGAGDYSAVGMVSVGQGGMGGIGMGSMGMDMRTDQDGAPEASEVGVIPYIPQGMQVERTGSISIVVPRFPSERDGKID